MPANIAPRPTTGCCHLANLMTWSTAMHCASIMIVSWRQLRLFSRIICNGNKTVTCMQQLENWRSPAVSWCPRSTICITDLPALWTIPFLHSNGRVYVGTVTGMDSPAWTACWPTASAVRLGPARYGQRDLARDRHQDGQRDGQCSCCRLCCA